MKKPAKDAAPRKSFASWQDYCEEAWRLKSEGMTLDEIGSALGGHASHAMVMISKPKDAEIAGKRLRPKEQADFIDDLVKDLPSTLSLSSRTRLAAMAFAVKKATDRASPTASERWEDAQRIQAAAQALMKDLFRWHTEFGPESGDPAAIKQAEGLLQEKGFTAEQIDMARLGFDPDLFSFVALGLHVYLHQIQQLHPASRGAGKKWRADLLAGALWEEFRKAGLEPSQNGSSSKTGDTAFVGACRKLFEAAGIEASPNAAARKVLQNRRNSSKYRPN